MINWGDLTPEEEQMLDEEFDRIDELQTTQQFQRDNYNRAVNDFLTDSQRERFNSGTLHIGVKT